MDIFQFFEINRYTNYSLKPATKLKQIIIDLLIKRGKKICLSDKKKILIMSIFSSTHCMDVSISISKRINGNYFFIAKCEGENTYINFSDDLLKEEIEKITERGMQDV